MIIDDGRFGTTPNVSSFQYINCTGSTNPNSFSTCTVEDTCTSTCAYPLGIRCQSKPPIIILLYLHSLFSLTDLPASPCVSGAVRLSDGLIQQEGRVEYCLNGVFGSVCDVGFDKKAALVVCKQLGYGIGGKTGVYYISFTQFLHSILLFVLSQLCIIML